MWLVLENGILWFSFQLFEVMENLLLTTFFRSLLTDNSEHWDWHRNTRIQKNSNHGMFKATVHILLMNNYTK